jgi:hypothetical protein
MQLLSQDTLGHIRGKAELAKADTSVGEDQDCGPANDWETQSASFSDGR